jgi:hypothetical protein
MDRYLERLSRKVRALEEWFEGLTERSLKPPVVTPEEVRSGIVRQVVARGMLTGKGFRFPYDSVSTLIGVRVKDRPRFDAVLDDPAPPTIREEIERELEARGCPRVEIRFEREYVPPSDRRLRGKAYAVTVFSRRHGGGGQPGPRIQLRVLKGAAERSTYRFGGETIHLGRTQDVMDKEGHRLIRHNEVAFDDVDDNRSVSRMHAHITYDERAREYRLFDDDSGQGTSVIRRNELKQLPGGASSGFRLRDRDVICLGEARLEVRLRRK